MFDIFDFTYNSGKLVDWVRIIVNMSDQYNSQGGGEE
jgi:hypothetical protein